MEYAVMLVATLNLMVTTALCVLWATSVKKDAPPNKPKKSEPQQSLSPEEQSRLLLAKRVAEERERQWQNFLNYNGESQKKGGD